ncbi:COCA1-like protein [Mya arenaria]|uniref:COCA1-like protein n=1 Tax=Mya arenaria TaxID=6604 RepID=A0ABY7DUL8_MYAAR|nr:mucin-5AC-like [Mya arenaria]WAR00542.1 COCA1-like protein [Mya arenaria]
MGSKLVYIGCCIALLAVVGLAYQCNEANDHPLCRTLVLEEVCNGNLSSFGNRRCPFLCDQCSNNTNADGTTPTPVTGAFGGRICSDDWDCQDIGQIACRDPLANDFGFKSCGVMCEFCDEGTLTTEAPTTTTTTAEITTPNTYRCVEANDHPLCRTLVFEDVCRGNLSSFGNHRCPFLCEQCSNNDTDINGTAHSQVTGEFGGRICSDDWDCREIGQIACRDPLAKDFGFKSCGVMCEFCDEGTLTTEAPTTTTTTAEITTPNNGTCKTDDDPICEKLGPDVCEGGNYSAFGVLKCPFHCEQCTRNGSITTETNTTLTHFNTVVFNGRECFDDTLECKDIGHMVCEPPLEEFGRLHCQVYCEFCFENGTETPAPVTNTPVMTTTTAEKQTTTTAAITTAERVTTTQEPTTTAAAITTTTTGAKTTAGQDTTTQEPPTTTASMTTTTTAKTTAVASKETMPTSSVQPSPSVAVPAECVDDPLCRVIGMSVCEPPLLDFSRTKCRSFCEFCYNTSVPMVPQKITTTQKPTATPEIPDPMFFENCNTTAELVFILDSSSSVGDANFEQMREFAQNVTRRLKTEYLSLNVTVVTFSNTARVALKLSETADLNTILAQEGNVTYGHGGTNTHLALDLMMAQFNKDVNNPKVAILITDGSSFDQARTEQAAYNAKRDGVVLFVIGIGEDVNQNEIKQISSDPNEKYMFQVTNFAALQAINDQFHARKCIVPTDNTTTTTELPSTTTTPAPTTTVTQAPTETQAPQTETTVTVATLTVASKTPATETPPPVQTTLTEMTLPTSIKPGSIGTGGPVLSSSTAKPSSVSQVSPVTVTQQTESTVSPVVLTGSPSMPSKSPSPVETQAPTTTTGATVTVATVTVASETPATETPPSVQTSSTEMTLPPSIKPGSIGTGGPVLSSSTPKPSSVSQVSPITSVTQQTESTVSPVVLTGSPSMPSKSPAPVVTTTTVVQTSAQSTQAPTTTTTAPITQEPTTSTAVPATTSQASTTTTIKNTQSAISTTVEPTIITNAITNTAPSQSATTSTIKVSNTRASTTTTAAPSPSTEAPTTTKAATPSTKAPTTTMAQTPSTEAATITVATTPSTQTSTTTTAAPTPSTQAQTTTEEISPQTTTTAASISSTMAPSTTEEITSPSAVMTTLTTGTKPTTEKTQSTAPQTNTKPQTLTTTSSPVTTTTTATTAASSPKSSVASTTTLATPPSTQASTTTTASPSPSTQAPTTSEVNTPPTQPFSPSTQSPATSTTEKIIYSPTSSSSTTVAPPTVSQNTPEPQTSTSSAIVTTATTAATTAPSTKAPVTPVASTTTTAATTRAPMTTVSPVTTTSTETTIAQSTKVPVTTVASTTTVGSSKTPISTAAPVTTATTAATSPPSTELPVTTVASPATTAATTKAPISTAAPTSSSTATPVSTNTPGPTSPTKPQSMTTASCISKVADVVFVVDASGSIGLDDFDKTKQFIRSIVQTFDIDPLYTQVALIEYSTSARIEWKLGEKNNMTELLEAIDNINYSGGGTSTSEALELMRGEGFDGERPGAPDIAIVITDGLSKYPMLTKFQADRAKNESISMFSIGIGNQTDETELLAIASSNQFRFQVGDYSTLLKLDQTIAHMACGVILSTKHYIRTTTPTITIPAGCVDLSTECDSYPRDSCTDYEPYARKNCAKTCGFCEGVIVTARPCEDKLNNCMSYGTDMCFSKNQYDWVDANCRHFCGFCGDKTNIPVTTVAPISTTTTEPPCVDRLPNCGDYDADTCTNSAYRGFAEKNCRKFCGFCYIYHTAKPTLVNGHKCPAWKLPEECTLENKAGQCCPTPKCASGFKLTVQRNI